MPPSQGSGFHCNPPGTKACALLLALSLTAYLYWRFMEGVAAIKHPDSCPPCVCDCPSILHGSGNNTADCTNMDPMMQEEISKSFIYVLTEELKLQADVADDVKKRATAALREAKKLSSQYQKEAEKCNIGMETCEDAREKAEEALLEERKISALWEKRAKDLGWKPKNDTKHASTLNP